MSTSDVAISPKGCFLVSSSIETECLASKRAFAFPERTVMFLYVINDFMSGDMMAGRKNPKRSIFYSVPYLCSAVTNRFPSLGTILFDQENETK